MSERQVMEMCPICGASVDQKETDRLWDDDDYADLGMPDVTAFICGAVYYTWQLVRGEPKRLMALETDYAMSCPRADDVVLKAKAELAAQSKDVAVGRAIANLPAGWYLRKLGHAWVVFRANSEFDTPIACGYYNSPYEALDAARLIDKEEAE